MDLPDDDLDLYELTFDLQDSLRTKPPETEAEMSHLGVLLNAYEELNIRGLPVIIKHAVDVYEVKGTDAGGFFESTQINRYATTDEATSRAKELQVPSENDEETS